MRFVGTVPKEIGVTIRSGAVHAARLAAEYTARAGERWVARELSMTHHNGREDWTIAPLRVAFPPVLDNASPHRFDRLKACRTNSPPVMGISLGSLRSHVSRMRVELQAMLDGTMFEQPETVSDLVPPVRRPGRGGAWAAAKMAGRPLWIG